MKKTVDWKKILDAAELFREEADACLDAGITVAGLAIVRASLEALLLAFFLLHVFDASGEELKDWGIDISKDSDAPLVSYEGPLKLRDMTEGLRTLYKKGFLSKKAYLGAERIRKWGNLIHAENLASTRKPSLRNLKARLNDLDIILEELSRII